MHACNSSQSTGLTLMRFLARKEVVRVTPRRVPSLSGQPVIALSAEPTSCRAGVV